MVSHTCRNTGLRFLIPGAEKYQLEIVKETSDQIQFLCLQYIQISVLELVVRDTTINPKKDKTHEQLLFFFLEFICSINHYIIICFSKLVDSIGTHSLVLEILSQQLKGIIYVDISP